MTQKHYIELARVIRVELDSLNPLFDAHAREAVARVARELANVCKSDNSRFRYDRFYSACGLDSDTGRTVSDGTVAYTVNESGQRLDA